MKVALVHDWLTTWGGAENVVKELLFVYPQADVYTLVCDPKFPLHRLGVTSVTTSFIQKLPLGYKSYRNFLPLFPLAIEQLDLREYDVIISSSSCVAKGVLTSMHQLHICYCHTPVRYAWDLYTQYLEEAHLTKGIKSWMARSILHYIRNWDVLSANRPDYYIANSHYIAQRVRKTYRREADVIYPPVDVESFLPSADKMDFYVTASRLVPYKRVDVIIDAFRKMPSRRLIVIGDGPERNRLSKNLPANVSLLGHLSLDELRSYLSAARAFIFAADEDFGILPVEAQACGTPVIAFGRGGSLETVKSELTGLFFDSQTKESICAAVNKFEARLHSFETVAIRQHAETFSKARFHQEISTFVNQKWMQKGLNNR